MKSQKKKKKEDTKVVEKRKKRRRKKKKEESTDAVLVREISSKTYTVTIPQLTSFYTPSRDGLEVKTEVNEQQISYTLEDEFGDFKMAIYVTNQC